jgi:hypothetical protein
MFGHVAQMPQLLRHAGLDHAVVWRGVPSQIDRNAFWWEAPDGSRVRAEYLPEGYGNGAHLPDTPQDLLDQIHQYEADHADLLRGPILWMNGTDHLPPQPELGRLVSEANQAQDTYHLEVTSLAAYLATSPRADLPSWSGELRSGARANLLMGVASNRVDVKQAAAAAERELERRAEPLTALFGPADAWPTGLLDEAWRLLIQNAAHDSVCACSADEVGDAVLHRYREARTIGEGLAARARRELGAAVPTPGAVVVNPAARTRPGLVELRLGGVGDEEGLQLVSQRPTEMTISVTRTEARQRVQRLLDREGGFHAADVEVDADGALLVTLHRDSARPDRVGSADVLRRIRATGDDLPTAPARIRLTRPPVRRVLARVEDVPGFGWQRWEPTRPTVEPVRAEGRILDNGLVRVAVDGETGSFSYNEVRGLGRLVDGGDIGDTYNHNPPIHDVVVDRPDDVEATVLESGPLRARVAVDALYRWPERVDGDRRVDPRPVAVRTILELRAGEKLVRVTVNVDNPCRDHRLRAHFPLPQPARASHAESAFAVVERGLEAEGGPTERALPTFPARRFVQAGGLTVVHEGLLEYELVDRDEAGARTLALTLLRATGMLSRGPMPYRPLPAGPLTPVDGPQLLGPLLLRYAVHVGAADPFALADDAFLPLEVVEAPGGGGGTDRGQALAVSGAEVSAVRREGGVLTLRVFNPRATATTVELPRRRGWLVDLRGRPLTPFEESFALGPHGIATAALDP